jgi:hypothetical protein
MLTRNRLLAGASALAAASFVPPAQAQDTGASPPPPPGTTVAVALGDSVAAIQLKLNSVPAGGSLVFPAGTYNFGGRTVRGKSGITVYARGVVTINNGPSAGTNGVFDFSNLQGWVVRGLAPGQGFVFNGSLVNATGANNFSVGNNVFSGQASNGLDGSAIRLSGASFGLIINNDFNNCGGNVLGMYNWDNITCDGNHFDSSYQPWSVHNPDTPTLTLGRNLIFRRNVILGARRAAIEIGPSSTGSQYFSGLIVDNNFFDNFNNDPASGQGTLLPISLVGQASVNSTVTNNFIRRGPINAGVVCVGIEFTGSGECKNNTIWNFSYTIMTYGNGWNVHDNMIYNDGSGPSFGTLNNGKGTGTFGPENIVTSPPPVPARPARIAW